MRTIKFRGRNWCGQWCYGNLIVRETDSPVPETPQAYKCVYIGDIEDGFDEEVEEETIGQFTGLLDKNGKEIYEGDIIKIEDEGVTLKPKVVGFYNGIFGAGDWSLDFYGENIIEIIGNIHDNPELLKGE